MRDKRRAVSPNLRKEKSLAIRQKLEALNEFKSAQKILVYISTEEEVDTHEFVKDCLAGGKNVFAPKVQGKQLIICRINTWADLEKGNFGILEPCEISGQNDQEKMDLILVPGIAFDKKGHRIGYGKGFYDSLLKKTKGHKIGLAFEEQLVDEIPAEEHDVPLDLIITDQSLIHP